MKTKSLISLAVASLMIVGCSKKEDAIEVSKTPISLSSGLSVQTRAANNLQSTQFEAGQPIAIFINENVVSGATTTYPQPLTFTANGTGGLSIVTQPFFPTSGNGVNIYGVYPAPSATTDVDQDQPFTVKADQSSDANYKLSDLMTGTPASNPVSRTTSSVPLTFSHRLTKINVNLAAGTGFNAALLTDAVVTIKGTKIVTTFSPKTGIITAPTGVITDILLKSATVPTLVGSAIIVPQTLTATTPFIEVKLSNNGLFTYKLLADKTFDPTKAYTYNVTLNSTGITVTTTITDWSTQTATDVTVTQ